MHRVAFWWVRLKSCKACSTAFAGTPVAISWDLRSKVRPTLGLPIKQRVHEPQKKYKSTRHTVCGIFLLACSFDSPVQSIRSLRLITYCNSPIVYIPARRFRKECVPKPYQPHLSKEDKQRKQQSKDCVTQLPRGNDESSGFQISFASKVEHSLLFYPRTSLV